MFGHRERGLYQQQDAEEFCTYVLNAISATLPTHTSTGTSNLVDDLFQIGFRCTWDPTICAMCRYLCPESGESYVTDEHAEKLFCNIRGGANEEVKVNFLAQVGKASGADAQGLKLGLEGEVEKHSDVLGRTALWKKTMEISSLPKYLCVMVAVLCWADGVVHAVLLEAAARDARGRHRVQDHARGGVPVPTGYQRVLHAGSAAGDERSVGGAEPRVDGARHAGERAVPGLREGLRGQSGPEERNSAIAAGRQRGADELRSAGGVRGVLRAVGDRFAYGKS